MRVAGLSNDNDWRFGRGRALYLREGNAIRQNVITRIRSFKRDWSLDQDAGIDWITLLGRRNTQATILREVERVTLSTEGVLRIVSLQVEHRASERRARISLSFQTVYGSEFNEQVGVEA